MLGPSALCTVHQVSSRAHALLLCTRDMLTHLWGRRTKARVKPSQATLDLLLGASGLTGPTFRGDVADRIPFLCDVHMGRVLQDAYPAHLRFPCQCRAAAYATAVVAAAVAVAVAAGNPILPSCGCPSHLHVR